MDELESPNFSECPRCGDHSLEHLETFAHCPGCLYSHDLEVIERPTVLSEIEDQINRLEGWDREEAQIEADEDSEAEFRKVSGW